MGVKVRECLCVCTTKPKKERKNGFPCTRSRDAQLIISLDGIVFF